MTEFLSIGFASLRSTKERERSVLQISSSGDVPEGLLELLFQLAGETGESVPSWVGRSLIAMAVCSVPILAAVLAETFAVVLTEGSAGQREQHLLTHDILEQKPASIIVTDFGLFFRDRSLGGIGIGGVGAEDQVEVAGEVLEHWIEAAGALELEGSVVAGAEADVLDDLPGTPVLDEEVGASLDGEGTGLTEVRGVVDGADREGVVEVERFFLKFDGGDEHGLL